MPNGISITMKCKYPTFTAEQLNNLINAYFTFIEGEHQLAEQIVKDAKTVPVATKQKTWLREPEPATISGLAFYLGFNSRQAFDDYESKGKLAAIIKRARLRVEAEYEKKLHQQSSSGAIFALKSLGWNEKPENKVAVSTAFKSFKIKLIETGPQLAGNEKEVVL